MTVEDFLLDLDISALEILHHLDIESICVREKRNLSFCSHFQLLLRNFMINKDRLQFLHFRSHSLLNIF